MKCVATFGYLVTQTYLEVWFVNKIFQFVRLFRYASEILPKKLGYQVKTQGSIRLIWNKQHLTNGAPAPRYGYTKITERQKKFPNNITNPVKPFLTDGRKRYGYTKKRESFNSIIQKNISRATRLYENWVGG